MPSTKLQFIATRTARTTLLACAIGLGAACGGGGSSSGPAPAPVPAPAPGPGPSPAPMPPPSADEASRFLMQSTFGPGETDIARVQSLGYTGWIDEQFALPQTLHLPYVQANYNVLLFGANFALVNGLTLGPG